MKHALGAMLVIACAVGAAFAQEEQQPEAARFRPHYDTVGMPYPIYPPDQMGRRSGAVVLCCTPNAERRLSCDVAFEAPGGREFGPRARRYQEQVNALTEESYADYQRFFPTGGAFPVLFTLTTTGSGDVPAYPNRTERDALCAPPPN